MTRAAFVLGSNGPETLGRLSRLSFAESDARRFAQAIGTQDIGFKTTLHEERRRGQVIDALDEFAHTLQAGDELLFYFAGHGVVSHGDLFLVLDHTLPGRLAGTALPWLNVKQIVGESPATRKVIVLDCCHAGEVIEDPLRSAFRGGFDGEAITTAMRGSSASILVACGPDGFAREAEAMAGGILTTMILSGLDAERTNAADASGRVSLESLRDWMWGEIDSRPELVPLKADRPLLLYAAGGPTFYLTLPKGEVHDTELLKRAAEQGDATAQLNLALLFKKGCGGMRSDTEAARFFKLAADQGLASAQFHLGDCFEKARGVPQSDTEAVRLYALAVEQDLPEAQCALGSCYEYGRGVSQSDTEAARLYELAAEKGCARALCNLGYWHEIGRIVPQSYAQAIRLYQQAADKGLADAQCNLGHWYEVGLHVPQSPTEAARLYALAAEQGLARAQCNLGVCYDRGRGVPHSATKAVALYRLAAEQRLAQGQYNLGVCYEDGLGVPQSNVEAVRLYRLAADQDLVSAQFRLGICCEEGRGMDALPSEAAHWYGRAAREGHREAKSRLQRLRRRRPVGQSIN